MLSIGKMVAGAERYYLTTVAGGREEYYTGSGEAPGYWLGAGAAGLGLSGEVAPDHLRWILAGIAPNGQVLTAGRVDPARRVTGFDLTFSAPKSVSLLYGLTEPTTAEVVRRAHARAVADALSYLETHALRVRRGAGGEIRLGAHGLVAGAFQHRTSRNGDPQLHTHVLVANVTEGLDGVWSAPDARLLYHHARTAGFLYQAVLRATLTDALGVRFGPVTQGMAEVADLSPSLLRAFSTRRTDIERHLAETGVDSPKAAEVAALLTRTPKAAMMLDTPGTTSPPLGPAPSLRARWQHQLIDLGFGPADLTAALGRHRRTALGEPAVDDLVVRLIGPNGLTAADATFERRDVVRSVAASLADGAPATEIARIADRVLAHPDVVALPSVGRGGEVRHSTTELLEVEANLLVSALARRDEGVAVVERATVHEVLGRHPSLTPEQRSMVRRLTTSGAGVEVVVGRAGTGKTTALAAACRAWEATGLEPFGTALAARATEGLAEGAAISSRTLAALFAAMERGEAVLTARSVVVVDEAGMVGTRMMARLLDAAAQARAKVVLVGDPRQLPEIEAGGTLAALADRLGAVELTTNRRQEQSWERAALDELRHGSVRRGLDRFVAADRVHVAPSMAETRRALVDAWLRAVEKGKEAVMLAVTRGDVAALNETARAALRVAGRLGPDALVVAERGFAVGDLVVCGRNDRILGVVNGTRGTIRSVEAGAVILDTARGPRRLSVDYLDQGHLSHGYALTVHKSQGATLDRAFVLATPSLTREAGYVAMSRARRSTDLFVPTSPFEDGLGEPEHQHRALDAGHDGVESVAIRLGVSRAKQLATAELAHPGMAVPTPAPSVVAVRSEPCPAANDAARYLESVMGRRPAFVDEARDYDRLTHAVARYRTRHGVTDNGALGPRPMEADRRAEYEMLLADLRHYGQRRGRSLERADPSLGLGR